MLLAAARGRQVASEVLLAQDLGKTLTAAPMSIRYLHLLHLSAIYNNLEGDNLRRGASAEPCRASVISPDARVATLLWPTSLKKTRKVLCMYVLCHRMFGDNSRQVHQLCRLVEQHHFAVYAAAVRWDDYLFYCSWKHCLWASVVLLLCCCGCGCLYFFKPARQVQLTSRSRWLVFQQPQA